MKILFFIIFLFVIFSPFDALSQGGWDIGYIQIDSVNSTLIGKDVKLDFAPNHDKHDDKSLRSVISKMDSTTLLINDQQIELIEKRKIYDDWGFYDEQYLECPNYNNNQTLKIYHSVIEDVTENSVRIRLYIEVYSKDKKVHSELSPTRWCYSLIIDRRELNGFIIKL